MGFTTNAMLNLSRSFCRITDSRRFSRIFSIKYYSSDLQKEESPREVWREDDAGNMVEEITEKSKLENMEDIDEDETKKKASQERGGKPVDEDKGMDVNWRPIAEQKPSSQSSS